jgi:hypothetical protein
MEQTLWPRLDICEWSKPFGQMQGLSVTPVSPIVRFPGVVPPHPPSGSRLGWKRAMSMTSQLVLYVPEHQLQHPHRNTTPSSAQHGQPIILPFSQLLLLAI